LAVIKNMIVRVGADLSGLTSEFKKSSGATGSFAKQTEQALKNSALSLGSLKKSMAQGGKNEAIVSLTDRIRELEAEQKALKAAGFSWGYEGFEGNEKLLRDLKGELNDYIRSLKDTGESTEEVAEKTGKLGAAAQSTKSRLKDIASNVLSLSKRSKTSTAGLESLVRSIRRIGLVTAGLHLVKSIFGELGSIVRQYISQNEALQAQTTALKNSLGQALAPAINLVANALSAVMPYIVGVSNAIGSLITNLFGSGWTTVADSANAAAAAIGGAGGAQKEFNRQLAGFDEITKLNAESGGGGGGGGASSTTTTLEGKTPAWLSGLSEEIQTFAAEGNFFGIGEAIADSLNKGIDNLKLSPTSLGTKVGKWLKNALSAGFGFVSTFDWYGSAELIANNFSDALAELFPKYAEIKAKLAEYSRVSKNPHVNVDLRPSEAAAVTLYKQIKEKLAEYSRVSKNPRVNIDAQANLTTYRDQLKSKFIDFQARLTTWQDNLRNKLIDWIANVKTWRDNLKNKSTDFQARLTTWQDNLRNKLIDWIANVKTWRDNLKNKSTDFQVNLTSWKDSLNNKVVDFQSRLTTWKDALSGKVVDFQSRLTTWKDALSGKVVDFQSRLTTWKDALSGKVVDFQSRLTTWKDALSGKVVDFQSRLTSWKDSLQNKAIAFQSNLTTWKDSLGNKVLTFAANVVKGWTGSLVDKLGISSLTSKLNMILPKIGIDWGEVSALGKTFRYPKGFSIKWNATGAILNGAQLFGRVGNTFLGGGEAGREAILPLDRNTWWMDKIADRVALRVSGGGQSGEQNITVNLVVDGKILASTVVRHVNAQARATGRNPLAAYM